MIELPDDELDKLFRKSTEELDPTYEPEDWHALKKRLDQQDGNTPGGWLKKWWPLGILMILAPVGIYFGMKRSNSPTAKQSVQQAAMYAEAEGNLRLKGYKNDSSGVGSEVVGVASAGDTKETGFSKKSEKPFAVKDERGEKRVLDLPRRNEGGVYQATEKEPEKKKKEVTYHSGARNGIPKKGYVNDFDATVEKKEVKNAVVKREEQTAVSEVFRYGNLQEGVDPVVGPEKKGHDAGIAGDSSQGNERDQVVLSVDALKSLPYIKNKGMALPDIERVKEEAVGSQEIQREIAPKIAIRLGYSPDLTTVGIKDFSKPGTAVSLLFDYALKPKLYIQTGIVLSEKIYRARASEYKLNKYVTSINTPYTVDGNCTMYEIPLGVRYDLRQTERSRIFTGVGATSYYVQKEKYVYKYSEYVHGQVPGWKGKTGWFWLSHVSASVGYEYRISNKFSLLAEPYIRIPIKGVGYGKVNIVTTGLWFSLRYTPAFLKK